MILNQQFTPSRELFPHRQSDYRDHAVTKSCPVSPVPQSRFLNTASTRSFDKPGSLDLFSPREYEGYTWYGTHLQLSADSAAIAQRLS